MGNSGLMFVWDNWRKSSYQLKSKQIFQIIETKFLDHNFQVVQMSQWFSVVLLSLAIFYVAVSVFIMEFCNSFTSVL